MLVSGEEGVVEVGVGGSRECVVRRVEVRRADCWALFWWWGGEGGEVSGG